MRNIYGFRNIVSRLHVGSLVDRMSCRGGVGWLVVSLCCRDTQLHHILKWKKEADDKADKSTEVLTDTEVSDVKYQHPMSPNTWD